MNTKALLPLLLVLVLLAGCVQTDPAPSTTAVPPTSESAAGTQETTPWEPTTPATTVPAQIGDDLTLNATGSARHNYTTAVSFVRYITSADQLPQNEALAAYDDSYFETGALVLVADTVNSGSVTVSIEQITVTDGEAHVVLAHEASGDMGIPAMTSWLAWAEVAPGLELTWILDNPSTEPNVSDR